MEIAGAELSIRDWLSAAAAKQPTPGGGSVAALVGALATVMGEMTLNYSTGRKANSPEQEQLLRQGLAELTRARELLLRLMAEDQAAYLALVAARELDQTDAASPGRLAEATQAAIAVPQAIMAAGMGILLCASHVAQHANKHLLSDLAVCCELALAAIRCAAINVRVNLDELATPDRAGIVREADDMVSRGTELLRRTMPILSRRPGK
jgi:formiminotetrahydrofolate cyclodeaminase